MFDTFYFHDSYYVHILTMSHNMLLLGFSDDTHFVNNEENIIFLHTCRLKTNINKINLNVSLT